MCAGLWLPGHQVGSSGELPLPFSCSVSSCPGAGREWTARAAAAGLAPRAPSRPELGTEAAWLDWLVPVLAEGSQCLPTPSLGTWGGGGVGRGAVPGLQMERLGNAAAGWVCLAQAHCPILTGPPGFPHCHLTADHLLLLRPPASALPAVLQPVLSAELG